MNLEHLVKLPTGLKKPTPILLLHGAWQSASCYELWLEDFAANGYETHAISLPGHGSSAAAKALHLHTIGDYTQTLEAAISTISPTPFVIAHSMGGAVLQEYLKTHDLPGAVLLAPVPHIGTRPFLFRYAFKYPLRYALMLMGGDIQRSAKDADHAFFHSFLTERAPFTKEQISARLHCESLVAGLQLGFLWRGDPQRVKTRLLVVAAEKDHLFLVDEQQKTAAAYNGEFLLIPDQGHELMLDGDWQNTAALIRAWLEKLPITSSPSISQ